MQVCIMITEKETLAVIYALKNLRLYLFKHLEVLSGNKAVIYLSSTPHLSQREARWVEVLTDFDYSIHQHGHEYVADPLSRLPDPQENALEFVLDIHPDEQRKFQKVISKTELETFEDGKLAPIIKRLEKSVEDSLHDRYFWNSENKRLYLTIATPHTLCIPEELLRLTLMQESNDCLTAVHPGRDLT